MKTETAAMADGESMAFLRRVLELMQDSGYANGSVAFLTLLAIVTKRVFLVKDAIEVHRSRSNAYEFDSVKVGAACFVKLPREMWHRMDCGDAVLVCESVTAAEIASYFHVECGAPLLYTPTFPAILNGSLAVAMEKVIGVQFHTRMRREIPKDDFLELLHRILREARQGRDFLAVAQSFDGRMPIYFPRHLLDDEEYDVNCGLNTYCRKTKEIMTEDDYVLAVSKEHGQADEVRDAIHNDICMLLDFDESSGGETWFAFRPFGDDDSVAFLAARVKRKFYLYGVPRFPSPRGGMLLEQASWIELVDYLVAYPDREAANNTLVIAGGQFRSIDFDGCCIDRTDTHLLKVTVIDLMMAAAVERINVNTIMAIAQRNGLSTSAAVAALMRASDLKQRVEQMRRDGMAIAPDQWAAQPVEAAFVGTFLPCFLGTAYREIFRIYRYFLLNMSLLAPAAGPATADEEYMFAAINAMIPA
ncbi:MAG: hypothetical protein LBB38_01200 [Puniceicoccales bacterium]|nr:hypothetical protein [Puniceicoccales bacterium]